VQEREREREKEKERTRASGRRACEKARVRTRGEKTREREREKRERERGHAYEKERERERESTRERERGRAREGPRKRRRGRVSPAQQRQQWGLRGRGLECRRDTAGPARIDAVGVPARLWSAEGQRGGDDDDPFIVLTETKFSSCQHRHCSPTHRTGGWRRSVGCGSSRTRLYP
jgi:hypothetical protein